MYNSKDNKEQSYLKIQVITTESKKIFSVIVRK